MHFVLSLIIAAAVSQAAVLDRGDCGDNKPPVPSTMTTPICHHTCAEYAAMGACGSTWNTCIPDHMSSLIRDSCKESCGHPDCAEEEEPDWCTIVAETGCKTASVYQKCPEACNAASCQVFCEDGCTDFGDGSEPIATLDLPRAYEVSFDFLANNVYYPTNQVLLKVTSGGVSSYLPSFYINMPYYTAKFCAWYADTERGASHKEPTTLTAATWYKVKMSQTEKLTGGYHFEVSLDDKVFWEETDLHKIQEYGNVAVYAGNDPWFGKFDGTLKNIKICT